MQLDPYAELGVPRDATADQVKRAYRARAKRAHPDAGGSAAAFQRLRRCSIVLLDEKKRQRYDATGDIEEDAPDNTLSFVMQCVASAVDAVVAQAVKQRVEPEHLDLVKHAKDNLNARIKDATTELTELGHRKKFLSLALDRVSAKKGTENRVAMLMRGQIRFIEQAEANGKRNLEGFREALAILADHSYRSEMSPVGWKSIAIASMATGGAWTP